MRKQDNKLFTLRKKLLKHNHMIGKGIIEPLFKK